MHKWWERNILREDNKDGADGGGGGGLKLSPEERKSLLGEFLAEVKKILLKPEQKKKDSPPDPKLPDPEPDDDDHGTEQMTEREKKLKKQLDQLQARQQKELDAMAAKQAKLEADAEARAKAASEKERQAAIRQELAKFQLNPESMDDAFRFFRDSVKFTESGDLVGGDDESPLADYVKGIVEKRTTWLPPRQVGGAGADAGKGGKPVKPLDIADIKPGMTADQRQAVLDQIRAAAQQNS